MAKVGRWSTTPANNNSTPPDGWPEGQAPSTVNDCAREMMAQIRTMLNDLSFIDLDHSPTQTTSTTFTIPGNVVSFYEVGRRVKAFDATTLYGTVISSSFTTNTGITLRLDSGTLTTSLTSVAVSVLSNNNRALPDSVYRQNNWIGNGMLDIWQRGNSFAYSAAAGQRQICDRFNYEASNAGTVNITRQERSANASNVPTLAQCGMLLNSSIVISVSAVDAVVAAGDFAILSTKVEGFDWRQFGHKPMLFDVWVNSNRTGTYCISMRNTNGDRAYVAEYAISAASTWENKTFTIPEAVTTGTWNYSSGVGLQISMTLMAGTTYQAGAGNWTSTNAIATSNQTNFMASAGHTIKFACFSLIEGNQKMPVLQKTYQEELDRAQRYAYVVDNTGGSVGIPLGVGVVTNTSNADAVVVHMPTSMRQIPSISAIAGSIRIYDGAATAELSAQGAVELGSLGIWSRAVNVAGAVLTAGRPAIMTISAGGKAIFKADL